MHVFNPLTHSEYDLAMDLVALCGAVIWNTLHASLLTLSHSAGFTGFTATCYSRATH